MSTDNRQRIEKASRFFARLHAFDLECPHCGTVYSIRIGNDRAKGLKASPNWDPWTGRFTCTTVRCKKRYVLGILAWPIIPAPHVASATPADQVPNPRQLAALRKEGGGFWLPDEEGQRYPRPHETNITTEPERFEDEDDED